MKRPQVTTDPFVPGTAAWMAGATAGSLRGLRLAVKDNIDIAGLPTSNGVPAWGQSHPVPTVNAPSVQRLLNAGATCVGKTILDDLAFSLVGDNRHYGAPLNPQAPDRFCGGSSCGSASAVAQGLADIALGTDTAGSIRVPASNCGVWGWRPTWGAVDISGVRPLAPSFDVLGVIAARAEKLQAAAELLLQQTTSEPPIDRLILPTWAFDRQMPAYRSASLSAARALADKLDVTLEKAPSQAPAFAIDMVDVFSAAQRYEARAVLGAWRQTYPGDLSGDIGARLDGCLALDPAGAPTAADRAQSAREAIRAYVGGFGDGAALLWPSASGLPLPLRANTTAAALYRARTLAGTAFSSLGGLPEVVLPIVRLRAYRLGLSLIGKPSADRNLLALAAHVSLDMIRALP